MQTQLSWWQRLIAAPLFGAVFGYSHYFFARMAGDQGGPEPAIAGVAIGFGVTVGALMVIWLLAYLRIPRAHGQPPRPIPGWGVEP